MATGPEMMVNALLKAVGFNPADFMQTMSGTIAAINDMHAQLQRINERLARLENHLGVSPMMDPIQEILPPARIMRE